MASAFMLLTTGCKSYWIEANVQNHTGQMIHQLEVDYPTASFGTNNLAEGAALRYRLQVRGSGIVQVDYIGSDGKTAHVQGVNLSERQHGELTIILLPDGKATFVPKLQPQI